ncbi:peptide-methionine (S)-S-oxide reductase [Chitinimonas naiadis]
METTTEMATLAGGDADALAATLAALPGVEKVALGQMCYEADEAPSGRRGLCQEGVVQVSYNPVQVGYADVLAAFFASHDPTAVHAQAPSRVRSAIYFHTPLQEQLARRQIASLTADRHFAQPIVTELMPVAAFKAA